MRLIGNILWFLGGGVISWLTWLAAGLLCCMTVVGIPIGLQCFKFAGLSFSPFGKEVIYGGGAVSFLSNLIWLLLLGLPMAIENAVLGCVWCITIVGIPFGRQFLKIAKLALMPFGAEVRKTHFL